MKIMLSIQKGARDKSNANLGSKPTQTKTGPQSKINKARGKKLIFIGTYLILLVAVVAYASSPSHYLAAKPYHDKKNGFTIQPPRSWQTKKNQNGALVSFVDPKNSKNEVNINIDKTNLNLSRYVKQVKAILPKFIPSYSIQNEFDTTINGQPVHVIDGEAQVKLVWEKDRVIVAIKNSKAYSVSATTKLNDWDSNKFVLFSSLKTFKLD